MAQDTASDEGADLPNCWRNALDLIVEDFTKQISVSTLNITYLNPYI